MGYAGSVTTPLVFSREYSIEELYSLIGDLPFEAGHPQLTDWGSGLRIVWPRMNCGNQIQVAEKDGRLLCFRSWRPAEPGKQVPSGLFSRLGSLFCYCFGPTHRLCRELTARTGRQLNSLNL